MHDSWLTLRELIASKNLPRLRKIGRIAQLGERFALTRQRSQVRSLFRLPKEIQELVWKALPLSISSDVSRYTLPYLDRLILEAFSSAHLGCVNVVQPG